MGTSAAKNLRNVGECQCLKSGHPAMMLNLTLTYSKLALFLLCAVCLQVDHFFRAELSELFLFCFSVTCRVLSRVCNICLKCLCRCSLHLLRTLFAFKKVHFRVRNISLQPVLPCRLLRQQRLCFAVTFLFSLTEGPPWSWRVLSLAVRAESPWLCALVAPSLEVG